jgi:hypothetical protein
MKFNQRRMTLQNISPQPGAGKFRPKNALSWQTIGLEPSNWMTTVRLRKLKLSFLNELFVTLWSVLVERKLVLGPKFQQIFWDEQGTSSQRDQKCRELTCFNDVTSSPTHQFVPVTRKVPWNLLYCEDQTTEVWQWTLPRTTPNRAVPHMQH